MCAFLLTPFPHIASFPRHLTLTLSSLPKQLTPSHSYSIFSWSFHYCLHYISFTLTLLLLMLIVYPYLATLIQLKVVPSHPLFQWTSPQPTYFLLYFIPTQASYPLLTSLPSHLTSGLNLIPSFHANCFPPQPSHPLLKLHTYRQPSINPCPLPPPSAMCISKYGFVFFNAQLNLPLIIL